MTVSPRHSIHGLNYLIQLKMTGHQFSDNHIFTCETNPQSMPNEVIHRAVPCIKWFYNHKVKLPIMYFIYKGEDIDDLPIIL